MHLKEKVSNTRTQGETTLPPGLYLQPTHCQPHLTSPHSILQHLILYHITLAELIL